MVGYAENKDGQSLSSKHLRYKSIYIARGFQPEASCCIIILGRLLSIYCVGNE